ncbi:GIP [Symbiodinium microadriaticum]|nr:GIP [Symbiodinium microadriaticum]
MRQLQQVYMGRADAKDSEMKVGSAELPEMPPVGPESAVAFSDWLYETEQAVGGLSDKASEWFGMCLRLAQETYEVYQQSDPLARLSLEPRRSVELMDGKWSRLERRVLTMMLGTLQKAAKDDAVTHRISSVPALLFRLHVLYAPGSSSERAAILRQLEGANAGASPADTVAALRKWRRHLQRAEEMRVAVPDSSILLRGIEAIAGKAIEANQDVKFRLALSRNQLQLQYRPTYDGVLSYYNHVIAELQQAAPMRTSQPAPSSSNATTEAAKLKALGTNSAGTGDTTSPRRGANQASGKVPCRFFAGDNGCTKGSSCKFDHTFASKEAKKAKCWHCGAIHHTQKDCPVKAGRTSPTRPKASPQPTTSTSTAASGSGPSSAATLNQAAVQHQQALIDSLQGTLSSSASTTAPPATTSVGPVNSGAVSHQAAAGQSAEAEDKKTQEITALLQEANAMLNKLTRLQAIQDSEPFKVVETDKVVFLNVNVHRQIEGIVGAPPSNSCVELTTKQLLLWMVAKEGARLHRQTSPYLAVEFDPNARWWTSTTWQGFQREYQIPVTQVFPTQAAESYCVATNLELCGGDDVGWGPGVEAYNKAPKGWSLSFQRMLAKGIFAWRRVPEPLMLCAARGGDEAMSPEELRRWKRHVANGHLPYNRRCRTSVETAATGRSHRRVIAPSCYTLSLDLCGPFRVKGETADAKGYRYALVGNYTMPLISGYKDYQIPEELLEQDLKGEEEATVESLDDGGGIGESPEEDLFEEGRRRRLKQRFDYCMSSSGQKDFLYNEYIRTEPGNYEDKEFVGGYWSVTCTRRRGKLKVLSQMEELRRSYSGKFDLNNKWDNGYFVGPSTEVRGGYVVRDEHGGSMSTNALNETAKKGEDFVERDMAVIYNDKEQYDVEVKVINGEKYILGGGFKERYMIYAFANQCQEYILDSEGVLESLPVEGDGEEEGTLSRSLLRLNEIQQSLIDEMMDRSSLLQDLLEEEDERLKDLHDVQQEGLDGARQVHGEIMQMLETVEKGLSREQRVRDECLLKAVSVNDDIQDYEKLLAELEGDLQVTHTVPLQQVKPVVGQWRPAIEKELGNLFEKTGTLKRIKMSEARRMEAEGRLRLVPSKGVFTIKPPAEKGQGFKRKYRLVLCGNFIDPADSCGSLYAGGVGAETLRTLLAADSEVWFVVYKSPEEEGDGNLVALLVTYVDDLFYIGPPKLVILLHKWISEEWPCSELQWATAPEGIRYLGMEVYQRESGEYEVTQQGYIMDLLRAHDLLQAPKTLLPCPKEWITDDVDPEPETFTEADLRFGQRLIGEQLWLAMRCRPDLHFTVSYCASWVSKHPKRIARLALRVLSYLHKTAGMRMILGQPNEVAEDDIVINNQTARQTSGNNNAAAAVNNKVVSGFKDLKLVGYSDASFAPFGNRSYGASLITVEDSPVAWRCSKQSFVMLSIMESELYQATEAAVLMENVGVLLDELAGQALPRLMKVDNASAVAMLNGGPGSWRTRHLKVRSAYLLERIQQQWLSVEHIEGGLQRADLATKAHSKVRLWTLLKLWRFEGLPDEAEATIMLKMIAAMCVTKALEMVPIAQATAVEETSTIARTGMDELLLFTVVACVVAVMAWEGLKLLGGYIWNCCFKLGKGRKAKRLRDFAKAAAEAEIAIVCPEQNYYNSEYEEAQCNDPESNEALDKRLMG